MNYACLYQEDSYNNERLDEKIRMSLYFLIVKYINVNSIYYYLVGLGTGSYVPVTLKSLNS